MKNLGSLFPRIAIVANLILPISSMDLIAGQDAPALVLQKNKELPITTFNITFKVGSADDPIGSEGIAFLTTRLIREGGVLQKGDLPARKRSELEDALFPYAADIGISIDREQIAFYVTSTADDSHYVASLLAQLVTSPAFDSNEFARLKKETEDYLRKQAPHDDEEELGKTALNAFLYGENHPYSHAIEGRIKSLNNISLDAVKAFYKSTFTKRRLTIGIAGSINPKLEESVANLFRDLPVGDSDQASLPTSANADKAKLLIVKGDFTATGVHLGQILPINRSHGDFPELYLASTAFGKHRSFVGRLMIKVREIRGLNYGTYSYVEDFPHGGHMMSPPTQASRTQQAFTVWARPTILENGCFILRQVKREVDSLANIGLTVSEFENTRSHLVGQLPILGSSLESQLGYAIDSLFYGIQGDFLKLAREKISQTKLESVNGLLNKYIQPEQLKMVVVTPDPDRYIKQILSQSCGIQYGPGVEKPADVLDEDKAISAYSLNLKKEDIRVISASSLFE